MNQLPSIEQQRQAVNDFFLAFADAHECLPATPAPAVAAAGEPACEELAA